MHVDLKLFNAADHLTGAVEVLHRVRAATKTYPPPVDADDTPESFSAWLDDGGNYLGRWVALGGSRVIGHISLVEPHDYILHFFETRDLGKLRRKGLVEITKFFVDPAVQRGGVGSRLFAQALDFAARRNRTPVLAVVSTSTDARSFYGHMGMTEAGRFEGIHGTNHVFTMAQ